MSDPKVWRDLYYGDARKTLGVQMIYTMAMNGPNGTTTQGGTRMQIETWSHLNNEGTSRHRRIVAEQGSASKLEPTTKWVFLIFY